MSKYGKIIKRMRDNPRDDWRIEDVKKVADRHDIDYRQPGTSHVTFRRNDGEKLTIPAHKPIKPIYIKMFIEFLEDGGLI